MAYPKRNRHTEFCIVVDVRGITVYGNRAAIRSAAEWLEWVADADPAEHFELHLVWDLMWHFRKQKNVWILFQRGVRFDRRNFEVTFMAVERKDLLALRRYERSGWLPANWNLKSSEATGPPKREARRRKAGPRRRRAREPRYRRPEARSPKPVSEPSEARRATPKPG